MSYFSYTLYNYNLLYILSFIIFQEFQVLLKLLDNMVHNTSFQMPVMSYPFLRHFVPNWSGWTAFKDAHLEIIDFINKTLHRKKTEFLKEQEPQDLIDVYLRKILEDKDDNQSSFHGDRGYQNLRANLLDLLMAGSETTSTAICWGILYMVRHPDIQKNVHNEIDSVIGNHRLPMWEDRMSMPYVEATLLEVQRYASIAPLGVPHYTTKDVKEDEYFLPKGN